jgi:hypothetical protein
MMQMLFTPFLASKALHVRSSLITDRKAPKQPSRLRCPKRESENDPGINPYDFLGLNNGEC